MQYTKHTFFKEIFVFVVLIHFLLVMLLLFFDKGDFEQEKFVINQNKSVSTIVFMPLHKRMPDKSGKSASGTSGKAHTMSYDEYQKALERRKKSNKSTSKSAAKSGKKSGTKKPSSSAKATADKTGKPAVKAVPIAPVEKVKALTTLRQEKPKAIAAKKSIPKKVVPKKKPAKIVKTDKKVTAKKTLTQKEKVILAKALAQKTIADKKALEKKPIEKTKEDKVPEKEDVKTEEVKAEQEKIEAEKKAEESQVHEEVASAVESESAIEVESDDSDDESDGDDIDLDNVIFVGRYDMEKREIEESIRKEIAKYWKSPIGISKTMKCDLLILVGFDGKAVRIDIKKPSGSRAYDMSARAAAYQMHYPKEVCGIEITITLQ